MTSRSMAAVLRPLVLILFALLLLAHGRAEAAEAPVATVEPAVIDLANAAPLYHRHTKLGKVGLAIAVGGPLLGIGGAWATLRIGGPAGYGLPAAVPMAAMGGLTLFVGPPILVGNSLLAAHDIRRAGGTAPMIPGVLSGAGSVAALLWSYRLMQQNQLINRCSTSWGSPLTLWVLAQAVGAVQLGVNYEGWVSLGEERQAFVTPTLGRDGEPGLTIGFSF
jgi:hypothetical protein